MLSFTYIFAHVAYFFVMWLYLLGILDLTQQIPKIWGTARGVDDCYASGVVRDASLSYHRKLKVGSALSNRIVVRIQGHSTTLYSLVLVFHFA